MSFETSLQRDLDRFYKDLSNSDFNIREVTKGALTQARANLNPCAFRRLNEVAVNSFFNEASYYTWYGMKLPAVDGTRLMPPNHKTVREEFGEHHFGPKADSKHSMAMGSMLYDVLNHLTIDAAIAPYASSELYHYRWNEEEAYKLLKSRIELEAFSGKTAKAVKQDFHAKVFLLTMCAAYAHP